MKPLDAEKLLGGYAAGILTEAEKTALFTAALERQELFDALADEEALRELLADPAAKAHLLALLTPRVRPLWRRPAVLGLAASFFALVTTSVMLLRHPAPESLAPTAAEATPTPREKADQKPAEAVAAPPQRKAAASQDRPAAHAVPVADQASPALATYASGVGNTLSEPKKEKAATPPSAVVEVVAAAEVAPPATSARVSASAGNIAIIAPQKQAGDPKLYSAGATEGSRPTYRLERLEQGRMRLTVNHQAGSHLYVLLRSGAEVRLVEPLAASSPTRAAFEFLLAPEEQIDLYELPEPAPDPKALPATGPVKGRRIRMK